MPLPPIHKEKVQPGLSLPHTQGKGPRMASTPTIHISSKSYTSCPPSLPTTRKRPIHALSPSHTQGKGLTHALYPYPCTRKSSYPCPLSLSKTRERSSYVPLFNPHTRERSTNSISMASITPTKGNVLPMPSITPTREVILSPFHTHGMGIAMPLFLLLTRKRSTHALYPSHTQGKFYQCSPSLPNIGKSLKGHTMPPLPFILAHGIGIAMPLFPSLTQGRGLPMPSIPPIHKEKFYQCVSIPPKHEAKV